MTEPFSPLSGKPICVANAKEKLDRLVLQRPKELLHHYLYEAAEEGISYFSKEVYTAFREAEKLVILLPEYAPLIKAKSAALYIECSRKVNEKIYQNYCSAPIE